MQEIQVQSLGGENSLVKEMATHSSILAWKIPWTEALGGLQSLGSKRVWHNLATNSPPPYMSIPISQFVHTPSPRGNLKFVLYICNSTSTLQISSTLPFFCLSLWGLWVLVHTRFVWALWASLVGMGFDSTRDFSTPTVLLELLLCPWTWGISSQWLQCHVTTTTASCSHRSSINHLAGASLPLTWVTSSLQRCAAATPEEILVSSGLLQRRGLWVQQIWVWHKPSWRRLPVTPP